MGKRSRSRSRDEKAKIVIENENNGDDGRYHVNIKNLDRSEEPHSGTQEGGRMKKSYATNQ
jgi:hypothetical protein